MDRYSFADHVVMGFMVAFLVVLAGVVFASVASAEPYRYHEEGSSVGNEPRRPSIFEPTRR